MSRDSLTREGEIGELKTQLDLTKQGFVVSIPLTASTNGYDLICDCDSKLVKIQVKSVKINSNNTITVPLTNRKNSSVSKNNRGQSHRYSELVDFLAVSVKNTDMIFYLPSSLLPNERASETFLLPDYEGRSKKIKLNQNFRVLTFT